MIKCFLNATPSEKGPLKNTKKVFSLIAIPSAKFYYHIPFYVVHHIDPSNTGLE